MSVNFMLETYKLPPSDPLYAENWAYYEGDQFKFWVGTVPTHNDPNRERLLLELQKVFICANLTRESVNRHVDALVSEFPQFQVKLKTDPDAEESPAEGQEAEKIVREWLDTLLNMAVQDTDDDISPITKSVIRMAVSGVGYLRLFSRKRYVNSPNLNQRVSLHSPDNGQIVMVYDDEGSLEAIEYLFTSGKIERQVLDPISGILHFTIYLNRQDQINDIPSPEEPPYDLDLNFNWTVFRIQAPPIITESVKDLQNAVNLVLTMLGRNVITAGFLERLLLNAQSPGEFVDDGQGDRVFVPDPRGFATGAGAVSFIQGLPLGDDPLAPEGYTNPQAIFREPVDVTSFEKSLNMFVQRFYNEVGQGHILTQGDGSISGVSRIQLTQDFKNTLKKHTEAIESMLNNVFYSALMMLSPLMGTGNIKFKNFFISSKLRLSDHLITPEEIGQVRENFKAGIISHPTTLAQLGIDDPQRELEIIDEERQAKIDLMAVEMETLAPFQGADNQGGKNNA